MNFDKWKSYWYIILLTVLGVLIFYFMLRDTEKGNTDATKLISTAVWLIIYIDYVTLKMKRQILDELKEIKKQLGDCTTLRENKQEQAGSGQPR